MSIESIAGIGSAATSGTSALGFGIGLENMDNAQMTRGVSDTTEASASATSTVGGTQATTGLEGTAGVGASSGTDFASLLSGGLDKLQGLQSTSDDLALKAATGNLTNVHDYMIASNEAQLATQLTAAVRNKAVEAFTEIMRMQI